ncbi:MAG: MOSC domain-containing protein [Actinomycetota bacterium]|nr:MOSC domain-containing protein [Actinomycetota bacterium]
MLVTDLRIYPVKSLGGVAVPSAGVEPQGLAGDRRWCMVDESGEVVTARECHGLLRLTAEVVDEDTIRVTDRADGASILVDTPLGLGPVPISLSRLAFASPSDADVGEWIGDRVGRRLRLVWQEDPSSRPVSGAHGGQPGDVLSMADTGPVLLASEASMTRLNEWISLESDAPDPGDLDPDDLSDSAAAPVTGPLDILRFRANVVVDGEEPFAEDAWGTVRIGEVAFRKTELCDRCVMTTIDPVTLAGGKEPIRTLARHRRWDGATWFGTRLLPLDGGTLHVGDAVTPGP